MESNEPKIVTLLDEDENEVEFEHLLTFKYENERYVALVPAAQADDDEAEVILLRVEHRDGEDIYVSVDNEVLLNEVFDEFLSLMDEIDGDEE